MQDSARRSLVEPPSNLRQTSRESRPGIVYHSPNPRPVFLSRGESLPLGYNTSHLRLPPLRNVQTPLPQRSRLKTLALVFVPGLVSRSRHARNMVRQKKICTDVPSIKFSFSATLGGSLHDPMPYTPANPELIPGTLRVPFVATTLHTNKVLPRGKKSTCRGVPWGEPGRIDFFFLRGRTINAPQVGNMEP